ncbi:MAG: radical SAM protein [Candidatus Zhuqueibacterota bacterium]
MKINEIFYSIQGESTFAGLPCAFVRLSGCNLRCRYCDTAYAYDEGQEMSVQSVLDEVRHFQCGMVEITGGEPLLQTETSELAQRLLVAGNQVLVETNGSLDISALPAGVSRIVDVKCPGSGESQRMHWPNLQPLNFNDNVKFVVSGKADFDWAVEIVQRYDLTAKTHVLISPCFGIVAPVMLAEWILQTHLPLRMQLQLHKLIWDASQRGV